MAKSTLWARVKTVFEGVHAWPECPNGRYDHIRVPHRHLFHVQVDIEQRHNDRDLEFLDLKHRLNRFIQDRYEYNLGRRSCEMIAEDITDWLRELCGTERRMKVEVSEDGENGAVLEVWPR